jgi:hypothetical protein
MMDGDLRIGTSIQERADPLPQAPSAARQYDWLAYQQ